MKIYELPYEIQKRVFQLQTEAGNKPDASLDLISKSTEGNFDWHKSTERMRFWESIDKGYFNVFYKEYPNTVIETLIEERAKDIVTQIMRELPFTLSEHNGDELIEVINKKLQPYIFYKRISR